jgi:CDP-glucose 4,6-dehydratase
LEGLVALRDRSVLLTGHTGFKGGWLALWLASSGARVHGYALDPPTEPSLFEVARVRDVLSSDTRADVRDRSTLLAALERAQPEAVFHLAAQPLVSEGFRDPLRTFTTNVIGTATVLDAIRAVGSVRAVVVVATDKVYENPETGRAFRETDPLGGHDPYSASKAATEIVVASQRSSFFGPGRHPARIATARAGNVIGGGDWAEHRLVPDCLRAFAGGDAVRLRHPTATRPWQHVLGPLSGYLALADRLLGPGGARFARAWNFGPDPADSATVGEVADQVAALWGDGAAVTRDAEAGWDEAETLQLDSSLAREELGWRPGWSLAETLGQTVRWHRAWLDGADMQAVTTDQIATHGLTAVS